MSNILSQNEIDELLAALTSGQEVPEEDAAKQELQNIKEYDFRTANKFSKDQMRTLHFIYDNYAARLSTLLSANLRTICEVEVISIEEQTFFEFINSMSSPVVVSIINMEPLKGSVLLEIVPSIAYEMINRLLGGTHKDQSIDKMFTEIELSVLEIILRKMIEPMGEAWEKIIKIHTSLNRIETSSQYVKIASANEPIAIVTMNVQIGNTFDIVNLCIPHIVIQPILKQLVIKSWYTKQHDNEMSPDHKKNLDKRFSQINLNLHTVLDNTYATVQDIMSTQVGDVIRINHHIHRPVTLKVEHIPKFSGFVGMDGANYAVQISEIIGRSNDD